MNKNTKRTILHCPLSDEAGREIKELPGSTRLKAQIQEKVMKETQQLRDFDENLGELTTELQNLTKQKEYEYDFVVYHLQNARKELKEEIDRQEFYKTEALEDELAEKLVQREGERTLDDIINLVQNSTVLGFSRGAHLYQYVESSTIGDCDTGYDTTSWWSKANAFWQLNVLKGDTHYWLLDVGGCFTAPKEKRTQPTLQLLHLFAEQLFEKASSSGMVFEKKATPELLNDRERIQELLRQAEPRYQGYGSTQASREVRESGFKDISLTSTPRAFLKGSPFAIDRRESTGSYAERLAEFCATLQDRSRRVPFVASGDTTFLYDRGTVGIHPRYRGWKVDE